MVALEYLRLRFRRCGLLFGQNATVAVCIGEVNHYVAEVVGELVLALWGFARFVDAPVGYSNEVGFAVFELYTAEVHALLLGVERGYALAAVGVIVAGFAFLTEYDARQIQQVVFDVFDAFSAIGF